jgi:hypothetical protein
MTTLGSGGNMRNPALCHSAQKINYRRRRTPGTRGEAPIAGRYGDPTGCRPDMFAPVSPR